MACDGMIDNMVITGGATYTVPTIYDLQQEYELEMLQQIMPRMIPEPDMSGGMGPVVQIRRSIGPN